jgi:hypothetical protein
MAYGESPKGEAVTQQHELTKVVDEAIARFRGRDLVSSAEVTDVLLDLRLLLLEVESLEDLLVEPTPTGGVA